MTIPPEKEDVVVAAEDNGDQQGPTGGEVSLRRIQLLNAVLVVAGAGVALLHSREMAVGVIVGGAMMVVNLRIITGVMQAVFGKSSTSVLSVGLYWVKFAVMLLLVGVLIAIFQLDPVGLLIGLSIFLIAITFEATFRLVRG